MDFTGKVVIVTGGAGGIGLATAKAFAEKGADVALVDVKEEFLASAKPQVEAFGHKVISVVCDVSKSDQVDATIKQVVAELGRIDVMVNNAGITRDNILLRMSEEDWDAVLNINLKSMFLFSKAVIRPMGKNKDAQGNACGGAIVNVASVVGMFGNAGQANYSAAKAGAIALTKSISKEYGKKKIRCNAVAPGFIRTRMTDVLPEEVKNGMLSMIPLGAFGEATDVAQAIRFLASDEASYITGQVLPISGGMAF